MNSSGVDWIGIGSKSSGCMSALTFVKESLTISAKSKPLTVEPFITIFENDGDFDFFGLRCWVFKTLL